MTDFQDDLHGLTWFSNQYELSFIGMRFIQKTWQI